MPKSATNRIESLQLKELTSQITPRLLPELLSVARQPELYDASVRRRAVSITRTIFLSCSEVVGSYKIQAQQVLLPHLQEWLQQFCNILASKVDTEVSFCQERQSAQFAECQEGLERQLEHSICLASPKRNAKRKVL